MPIKNGKILICIDNFDNYVFYYSKYEQLNYYQFSTLIRKLFLLISIYRRIQIYNIRMYK